MVAKIALFDPGILVYAGRVENVTFTSNGVCLSGVLVRPFGRGPFPAVVMVHGSGPATHAEMGSRIYANAFLRKGLAVLVYDKRGSGKSTGDLRLATYGDLVGDVVAAVRFLGVQNDVLHDKIGLFGRSEGGGWVAPLAAAKLSHVAFFIDGVGPAVTPVEQGVYAIAVALRNHGYGAQDIREAQVLRRAIWAYYRRGAIDSAWAVGASRDSLRLAIVRAQAKAWYKATEDMPVFLPAYDRRRYAVLAFNSFFDPVPALVQLDCPILAVLAQEDERVPTQATIAVLKRLGREQQKDITIRVYPSVGHTFMTWRALPPPFPRGYLNLLGDWAKGQVSRPRPARHDPVSMVSSPAAHLVVALPPWNPKPSGSWSWTTSRSRGPAFAACSARSEARRSWARQARPPRRAP